VWTSLGLSALYFVVAGIQFWITQYIVEVLQVPYRDALGAFTLVSATGPVFGVIFGGWLVDYLGGYKGPEGVARTTKIILTLGILALIVALPAAFVKEIGLLMPLIWLLLFFGGAIVPAAVGICLSAVPRSIRPFSSSVSMVVYNILGHSAGTLFPGVVMDIKAKASGCVIVKSEPSQELEECAKEILTVGMQIVLLWAFAALFTFGKAGWRAHWAWESKQSDAEKGIIAQAAGDAGKRGGGRRCEASSWIHIMDSHSVSLLTPSLYHRLE
jgi:MFS family permease